MAATTHMAAAAAAASATDYALWLQTDFGAAVDDDAADNGVRQPHGVNAAAGALFGQHHVKTSVGGARAKRNVGGSVDTVGASAGRSKKMFFGAPAHEPPRN